MTLLSETDCRGESVSKKCPLDDRYGAGPEALRPVDIFLET